MQSLLRATQTQIRELEPTVRSAVGAAADSARRQLDRAPDMAAAAGLLARRAVRRGRPAVTRHPVLLGAGLLVVAAGGVLAIPGVRSAIRQTSSRVAGQLKARFEKTRARASEPDAHAKDRQEQLLDEGIEESFPASDPVSVKRIT